MRNGNDHHDYSIFFIPLLVEKKGVQAVNRPNCR